jgi:hypothetical protein
LQLPALLLSVHEKSAHGTFGRQLHDDDNNEKKGREIIRMRRITTKAFTLFFLLLTGSFLARSLRAKGPL